jgi:hypothetical protein
MYLCVRDIASVCVKCIKVLDKNNMYAIKKSLRKKKVECAREKENVYEYSRKKEKCIRIKRTHSRKKSCVR